MTVEGPPSVPGGTVVRKGEGTVVVIVMQSSHGGVTPVMTVEGPPLVAGGTVVQKGTSAVVVIVTQSVQGRSFPDGTGKPGTVGESGEPDPPRLLGTLKDPGYSV